ncbi:MAG: ADP-ribosylation factor-like protein [Gammaproteobacteria bacterium]|nr:ADP-ribosylation factor-like protein [Gammaproteobacteria bacterium]MDE0650143.1 ADP-ribosylation factor-like protein [Gammaproteobacteria bacterium]MXW10556.1 gliding-motility protein MglA [Gammaproteobacteria bacterium]MYC52314.1 gliding-motility protein MglA [Gammaproteobacteria bacterium]
MPMTNYAGREVNCKILYCGPGQGGKTTNIEYVHSRVDPGNRGELISLATKQGSTLLFDFLALDLGDVQGLRTRFHLYTVPGQAYFESRRRILLEGVDGVVFVADSQTDRDEANAEAMQSLYETLEARGCDVSRLPFVIQYNKRDLPGIAPVEQLRARLNPARVPDFESVATEGKGVFETLAAVSRLVVQSLR